MIPRTKTKTKLLTPASALLTLLLLHMSFLPPAALSAEDATGTVDWPQFRGPQRTGLGATTGLLERWPAEGPPRLWRVPIGAGFSGLIVSDGRLYTMFADRDSSTGKGREYAAAFDASSGQELWRVAVGERFNEEFGDGPRSTPTLHQGIVYFLSSSGHLAALRTGDGKQVWAVELTETFGGSVPYYGFCASPLVEGDMLLVDTNGSKGKALVAFDRVSGKLLWTALDTAVAYSSPIVVEINDVRQLVLSTGQQLVGLTLDGKLHWHLDWPDIDRIAMPLLVAPDQIFFATNPEQGAVLLEIGDDQGRATVEQVWRNPRMRNHVSSSVIWQDYLYGFDNATLRCISLDSGEHRWAKRGFGKGSLITADGLLFILSDRGKLALAAASPDAYQERGSLMALPGKCWTEPSLAAGRLYLRNQSEMTCFALTPPLPRSSEEESQP